MFPNHLLQNLMLKRFTFFQLPDYYLMVSKSSYSWCAVSVLGITPVFMGVRRGKMGICHSLETGTKNKKFLENLKSED